MKTLRIFVVAIFFIISATIQAKEVIITSFDNGHGKWERERNRPQQPQEIILGNAMADPNDTITITTDGPDDTKYFLGTPGVFGSVEIHPNRKGEIIFSLENFFSFNQGPGDYLDETISFFVFSQNSYAELPIFILSRQPAKISIEEWSATPDHLSIKFREQNIAVIFFEKLRVIDTTGDVRILEVTSKEILDSENGVAFIDIRDVPEGKILVEFIGIGGMGEGNADILEYILVKDSSSVQLKPQGENKNDRNDSRIIQSRNLQNYPNPFNSSTEITFTINISGHTTLKIFNILGQCVRTLIDGEETPGNKKITWDGNNDNGNQVASGIYFFKLVNNENEETRKMIMLK